MRAGSLVRAFANIPVRNMNPARKGKKISVKQLMYTFFGVGGLFTFSRYYNNEIDLVFNDNDRNIYVVKRVQQLGQAYMPTFYLPTRLLQALFCSKIESTPFMQLKTELLKVDAGRRIRLDWSQISSSADEIDPEDYKISVILGPMNDGEDNSTTRHLQEQLQRSGFRAVHAYVDRQADDSNTINLMSDSDTDMLLRHVQERYPKANVYLAAFSTGAISSMNWLDSHRD